MHFTWIPADFLVEMKVRAMTHLPIWLPPRDDYPTPAPFEPGAKGFHQISGRRAIEARLTFRPLAETARAIIDEFLARGETWEARPGCCRHSVRRDTSPWPRGRPRS
ncbi:MAG: hypothetical protein GTO22_05205 [Gemmatimonadales bacterium]|nr:hypothetical protein [Gemmatimonadales bacterium]